VIRTRITPAIESSDNRKGGRLVATRPFCVWGLGKIVVYAAGGLILAECLQRFVAQHPEMAVQGMLAF